MFFAHSTDRKDKSDWQQLKDHLAAVAALASERGEKFGAQRAAAVAGIFHDLGKYTAAFQRRLEGSDEPVDHSTAGAQEVRRFVGNGADRGVAELIAYAIAGHHSGLPDREGETDSLTVRLAKVIDSLDPAWRGELSVDPTGLMPAFRWESDRSRFAFQLGILARMIFSCLVDADRPHDSRSSRSRVDRNFTEMQVRNDLPWSPFAKRRESKLDGVREDRATCEGRFSQRGVDRNKLYVTQFSTLLVAPGTGRGSKHHRGRLFL